MLPVACTEPERTFGTLSCRRFHWRHVRTLTFRHLRHQRFFSFTRSRKKLLEFAPASESCHEFWDENLSGLRVACATLGWLQLGGKQLPRNGLQEIGFVLQNRFLLQ
jgi:hypothetical protein